MRDKADIMIGDLSTVFLGADIQLGILDTGFLICDSSLSGAGQLSFDPMAAVAMQHQMNLLESMQGEMTHSSVGSTMESSCFGESIDIVGYEPCDDFGGSDFGGSDFGGGGF